METRRKVKPEATFEQALSMLGGLLEQAALTEIETVSLLEAQGRVLAEPLIAPLSVPLGMLSGMDGIALRGEAPASEGEVVLEEGRNFAFVDTGNPIPEPFDRVLMIERVHQAPGGPIRVQAKDWPEAFDNVRLIGEDIVGGEVILPKGRKIMPEAMCLSAAAGVSEVRVHKRPTGCILPTGSEIRPVGSPVVHGQILDTNSLYIERTIEAFGGIAKRLPPVQDDPDRVIEALREALHGADFVFIVAGTSAGRHDYVHGAIEALGKVLLHGVQVKPGKPLLLGEAFGKPIVGVPGYPFGAFAWTDVLVPLLVCRMMGQDPMERVEDSAKALTGLSRQRKVREVLRVKLVNTPSGEKGYLTLPSTSSRMRPTLERDGDVVLQAGKTQVAAGEDKEVWLKGLYREPFCQGLIVGVLEPCLELALANLRSKLRIGWSSEGPDSINSISGVLDILGVLHASSLLVDSERLDPKSEEDAAFVPLFERPVGLWRSKAAQEPWVQLDPNSDTERLFERLSSKMAAQRPMEVVRASRPLQMMELLAKGKAKAGFGGPWDLGGHPGLGFETWGRDMYGLWISKRTLEMLPGFEAWLEALKREIEQVGVRVELAVRVVKEQKVLSLHEARLEAMARQGG